MLALQSMLLARQKRTKMCSIVILNHSHKEFPLIIAANRDEDYARPSAGVQVLENNPLIIGGKDLLKGGTWLAVNKHSLFVAITNQGGYDNTKESRGQLVLDLLKSETCSDLINRVEEIEPARYNGFNLVFGNQDEVYVAHSYILPSMVLSKLDSGTHLITSDIKFSGEASVKATYLHKHYSHSVGESNWLECYKKLKATLANSEKGFKVKSRKKAGVISGYSTVSSSILAFDANGLARFKFFDRKSPRIQKESGGYEPRYKDYIDLWRNPNGAPETNQGHFFSSGGSKISESEESDDDDDPEIDKEESAKEVIEKAMKKMKPYTWDHLPDHYHSDDYRDYDDD
jgi:hypothetical protein